MRRGHGLSRPARWAARASVVGAVVATSTAAHAQEPDKAACVAAFEKGQDLQLDGKLIAARDELATCGHSACPTVVRDECSKVADRVNESIARVIIAVRDASGSDIVDARVLLDGEEFQDTIDGRAREVDPGTHTVTIEIEGEPPITKQITVRESEKDRTITVELESGDAAGGDVGSEGGEVPVAAYVLGGVGVLGLGGFAFFGLSGLSSEDDLNQCKPDCTDSEVDDVPGQVLARRHLPRSRSRVPGDRDLPVRVEPVRR